MRRKRKQSTRTRRRLRWGPILAVLFAANLIAGVGWSQVTRVRTVRIEGAAPHDRVRLAEILAQVQDIPVARLNVRNLEWQVLQKPEVKEAAISLNPFGYALLKVAYRTPVVQLEDRPGIVMDEDGVMFAFPRDAIPTDIALLKLNRKVPPTLLSLAGDWPAARIAKLAPQVRAIRGSEGVKIEVDDRGAVCLNMSAGRVVLGSTDDLERKLAVLRQRMADDPGELSRVLELNLTQPDRPSVVPRPDNKNPNVPERNAP